MKTLARLVLGLALGAIPGAGWAKGPVVVELFTAQGCASCKPANALIDKLVDRPGVIALMWSVDYWDYLGWEDTFARPAFAARQQAFVKRLGPRDVYTPQVIVNGAAQVSGADGPGVAALIAQAEHPLRHPPSLHIGPDGRVSIGDGAHRTPAADIWLVRYDPRKHEVEVKAGDNEGATVVLRNVVRQAVRLGGWTGRSETFKAPAAPESGLGSVVLVEAPKGGPILAVTRLKPKV
jgi:hypothetical protein